MQIYEMTEPIKRNKPIQRIELTRAEALLIIEQLANRLREPGRSFSTRGTGADQGVEYVWVVED